MHALLSLCLIALQPPAASPIAGQPAVIGQPAGLSTLSGALDTISWDPAQRGVLLVVGAEMARPTSPLPPPASGRGYNVRELAGYFDRLVVPVGNVAVLVPTTMRVFTRPTQSPDEASWSNPQEAFMALVSSLSKSQWQTLSSENGLGLGDLSANQRGAFLAALPETVGLRPVPAMIIERTESGGTRVRPEPLPAGMAPVTLSPEQRSGVRIRLNRQVSFMYAPEGMENTHFGGGSAPPGHTEAGYALAPSTSNRSSQSGVVDVPNRAKPGDLDFARLRGTVSLTGAATVGEMVKRAAQVSGLELYADPRVASLSVRVWGESATTGDVLSALCRAVTGAFRRVGPAYVLTHDHEGIAALQEPFQLWQSAIGSRLEARRKEQEKAIREANPASLIGLAPSDPRQLSPEMLRRLDTDASQLITVSELPPAIQQQIRSEIAQMQDDIASGRSRMTANGQPVTSFRTDRVKPDTKLKISLIVPTYGAVAWDGSIPFLLQNFLFQRYGSGSAPSATDISPLVWPSGERILLVNARTPDEAKALARAARDAKLTAIWIKAPLNAARAKTLLDAAQSEGIAVGLALAPFEAPIDALPTGATPDIAATGVTSDVYAQRWLPAMNPQTAATSGMRVDERLLRGDDALLLAVAQIARLPKLAGLYLIDLVPAGYQKPSNGEFSVRPRRPGDFGYTLENRLAFLRLSGADPIDIGSNNNYSTATSLPFFPPFAMLAQQRRLVRQLDGSMAPQPPVPNPLSQWQEMRAAQNAAFVPRLQARIQQTAPELALYTEGTGAYLWIGSWDKPEQQPSSAMPPLNVSENASNKTILTRVRSVSRRVFDSIPGYTELTPTQLRRAISGMATSTPGWDGVVLDFLNLSPAQTLSLLGDLNNPDKGSAPAASPKPVSHD